MTGSTCIRRLAAVLSLAILPMSGPPAEAAPLGRPSIIGGVEAPAGRWPFVVGLLDAGTPSNLQAQFCAGTLIHPRFVLTAAHCVEGTRPGAIRVLVGTRDLAAGGRRVKVARIHRHPAYEPVSGAFDAALLRLAEPVRARRFARPIGPAAERYRVRPGVAAVTVGWGDTAPGDAVAFPTLLHQVTVPVVPRAACNLPSAYAGQVTASMLCAGPLEGGRDSCQGDSGGPLMVRDADGRLTLQAGIVSWGNGCALPGYPGVYTRVAAVRPWIGRVMLAYR